MTFSIIIPVYQVEKYLVQCLESVLKQNFNDYEVILIDDGSTDNSGKICDDYVSKYSNIEVIHQTNSGPSVARNNGMERANGDYIVFIDSDDYVEHDSFKQIYLELKKSRFPDLLITPFKTFKASGKIQYHDLFLQNHDLHSMSKEQVIHLMFVNSSWVWSAWRYIVKRTLVEQYKLKFPVGMIYEDNEWTPRLFLFAQTFGLLNYYWYNYRRDNMQSIINNIHFKNTMDNITLLALNIPYVQENCNNPVIVKFLTQRLSKEFLAIVLLRYPRLEKKDRKTICDFFKTHQKPFKRTTSFKFLVIFTFAGIFGLDLSLKIYKMFIRLKRSLTKKNNKENNR